MYGRSPRIGLGRSDFCTAANPLGSRPSRRTSMWLRWRGARTSPPFFRTASQAWRRAKASVVAAWRCASIAHRKPPPTCEALDEFDAQHSRAGAPQPATS
ncbi:hypothetical protein [Streptomyces sp. NPDC055210]